MALDPRVRKRLLVSAIFALVMGTITFAAAWVGAGIGYAAHGPVSATEFYMRQLNEALETYRAASHDLPDDLIALQDAKAEWYFRWGGPGIILDGWRHPLLYARQQGSFTITSLGADGQPGGVGIDQDLVFDGASKHLREPSALMTPLQFLGKCRVGMLIWCLVCMLVSGLLCFVLSMPKTYRQTPWMSLVIGGLVTLAAAMFFTFIMASLEIVKYH